MLDPTDILEGLNESAFDDLARLAAHCCAAPYAVLHLRDETRGGQIIHVGLESLPNPVLVRFLERMPFPIGTTGVFPDLTQVPHLADNALVTGSPSVMACAGVALVSPDGTPWGTLCVLDSAVREFLPQQGAALAALGRQIVTCIRLRQMLSDKSGTATHAPDEPRPQKNALFERLVNAVTDYALYALTPTGDIVSWNNGAARLKGYTAEEIIGQNFSRFYSEEDRTRNVPFQGLEIARTQGRFEGEGWRFRKDGTSFWANVVISPIRDADGTLQGFSKVTRDITERKRTELAFQDGEERFRSAILAINDGLVIQNRDGEIILSNKRAETILGLTVDQMQGKTSCDPVWRMVHPDGTPWAGDTHPASIALRTGTVQRDVLMGLHRPDTLLRWLNVSAAPVFTKGEAAPSAVVTTFTDITERRRLTQEREVLMREAIARADRDGLTALFNHRTFHHELRVAGKQVLAAREGQHANAPVTQPSSTFSGRRKRRSSGPSLAVALLDMDNFKFFNDTYGHLVGDDVLCHVADALRACCREGDIIARIGGDEFAILLPNINRSEAMAWAERLRTMAGALSYPVEGEMTSVPLRLSVGVALFPDEAATTTDALYLADKRAMQNKTGELATYRSTAERLRIQLIAEVDGFSLLDALVDAVDDKDRYTRHHSEDVMTYVTKIAEELGLPESEKRSLQIAALVHDVGKIGVPSRILRQPGTLSASDFDLIKRHADLGGLLVGAIPELAHTVDLIRHHHERWDGNGYPSGLRGEAIPLLARILGVADAYSAMTLNRPYRKGLSPQEAREQLRAGAGSQWDRVCVDALMSYLEIGHRTESDATIPQSNP